MMKAAVLWTGRKDSALALQVSLEPVLKLGKMVISCHFTGEIN